MSTFKDHAIGVGVILGLTAVSFGTFALVDASVSVAGRQASLMMAKRTTKKMLKRYQTAECLAAFDLMARAELEGICAQYTPRCKTAKDGLKLVNDLESLFQEARAEFKAEATKAA